MNALWSGCRIGRPRIRGALFCLAGEPFIMYRHPVLGETFFAVDPETIRIEVYHAAGTFYPAETAAEPLDQTGEAGRLSRDPLLSVSGAAGSPGRQTAASSIYRNGKTQTEEKA